MMKKNYMELKKKKKKKRLHQRVEEKITRNQKSAKDLEKSRTNSTGLKIIFRGKSNYTVISNAEV